MKGRDVTDLPSDFLLLDLEKLLPFEFLVGRMIFLGLQQVLLRGGGGGGGDRTTD